MIDKIIYLSGLFCCLVLLFFIGFVWLFGIFLSNPGYSGVLSDHFNGRQFYNPNGQKTRGFLSLIKYILTRHPGHWPKTIPVKVHTHPILSVPDTTRTMFVNHSTFLIQAPGLNLLTDPIWSQRCSPLSWLGPRRRCVPGIAMSALPSIDVVCISHDHYDHLDIPTLQQLMQQHRPLLIVPLGVKKILQRYHIDHVVELDWHQTTLYKDWEITAVPAVHFSGRGWLDRNQTLWCGFILKNKTHTLYYAGDTAYDATLFKAIGKAYPNIDWAFLPIGAYVPRWFMSPIHVSPQEAVKIHQDIQAQQSMAMHFGTFVLADEAYGQANKEVKGALQHAKLPIQSLIIPQAGQWYDIKATIWS